MNIHTMTLKKQLTAHEMKEVKNYLYDTNTHGDTYQQSGVTICNRFASQGINIKLVPNFNPDDFGIYIGQVYKALENYNFERYGYKLADNIAPTFNFGAQTDVGARIAVPVIRI